jgi:excinuclease ABC subunit C
MAKKSPEEVLAAFVSQYYIRFEPPREILLDREIPDADLLVAALSASAERKVQLKWNVRGERAGVELASRNAQLTLHRTQQPRCAACAQRITARDAGPGRAGQAGRVFDISHTLGEATWPRAWCSTLPVGARAVSPLQHRGIEPGDDFAAMRQAIDRRFRRAVEEQGVLPDVLLIDGGAGSWRRPGRTGRPGRGRRAAGGRGQGRGAPRRPRSAGDARWPRAAPRRGQPGAAVHPAGARRGAPLRHHRPPRPPAEGADDQQAGGHPGIGPRRRASLLKHFGGLVGLKAAGEAEIAKVEGINDALAAYLR